MSIGPTRSYGQQFEVDPFGEAVAHDVGPADDGDRYLVGEGERTRESGAGGIGPILPPRTPRTFVRIRCTEHPGTQPPQGRDRRVVREQTPTRDHDTEGVIGKTGQAVGRIFQQGAVVVVGPSRQVPQKLERLHHAGA